MTGFWLSWRNLWRQRLRTVLMVVAVAVAFALYGTLFGIDDLLGGRGISGGRDVIVHHRAGLLQTMPAHYRDAIARTNGVASVAGVAVIGGYVGERANRVATLMVDAEPYLAQNAPSLGLSAAERADFLAGRDTLIVDERTARERGWSAGQRVIITSEIAPRGDGSFDWPFRIAGIYRAEKAEDAVTGAVAHLGYFAEAAAFGRERVNWFAVRARDEVGVADIAAAIDARFANSESETRTEPAAAMARALLSQVIDFALVIRLVVGAAFVTILMIVGNSIALAVRQRTRELGVLRAIGFDAGRVARIVLGEALMVMLGGALLGLSASMVLLALMASALTGAPPSLAATPVAIAASGLAIALLFGAATAALPTWRASRIRPAAAFSRS